MKSKRVRPISIVTLPASVKIEEAREMAVRDRNLVNAACIYANKLRDENVEVFKRYDNILATENGYYIAYYDEDIRKFEGGIDNPIPYKGKDGRMKVEVKTKQGRIENDLATLVAGAFPSVCPNPKEYKHVFFKDWNYENCNASNLFWCSYFEYRLRRLIKKLGLK